MDSITLPTEGLYQASLHQGQVKHAVKTALTCCLATGMSYIFRLPSGQLAPVFAFLLLTAGMPSPRLNWLLALFAITVSAITSALILVAFRDALFLYLAVTLLWIFTVLLFSASSETGRRGSCGRRDWRCRIKSNGTASQAAMQCRHCCSRST
jgi:hypothetical protein